MAELEGKVAVITGGASGIGEASVRLFVEEGAKVVIADMQRERGEALAAELGDAAVFVSCEVRQEDQVKATVDAAAAKWGRLDCMFNNAGFGGAVGLFEDIPAEEFDMTFDVLVKGVFLGMKHAIPVMRAQGSGSIINTGSIAGVAAGRGPLVYSAAKAALHAYVRGIARPLGKMGVRINAVAPGNILFDDSVWSRKLAEDAGAVQNMLERDVALARLGTPRDVAELVAYLAAPRTGFATGGVWTLDGGQVHS